GVKWESDGRGEYTLEDATLPERGTTVVLHLKADEDEFLDAWRLSSLVHRYSDHVAFPIRMPKEAAAADDSGADAAGDEGDASAAGAGDGAADAGTPAAAGQWEAVNDASALWTRPKAEISDEEYQNFYKALGHD